MRLASLRQRPAVKLFTWIVLVQLAGALGSVFTVTNAGSWYVTLTRPRFAPPNLTFGLVRVTLFTLVGAAAWLVSWHDHPRRGRALVVLIGHLVINIAWSAAFLGLWSPAIGLAVIVVLLVAILTTMRGFAAASRCAAVLFVPYLLWTYFAATLNYGS